MKQELSCRKQIARQLRTQYVEGIYDNPVTLTSRLRVAVLTYKVLNGSAPPYLGRLTRVAGVPGRRALRSANTHQLVVPSYRLSTVGSRTFPVAAARIWNTLPVNVVSASTVQSFRHKLKSFLFDQSFPN